MDARSAALLASLGLITLLAALTIYVIARNGFDPLIALSVLIVTFLGIAVLGALNNPPPEE
jgi:hypothetical protein